MNVRRWGRIVEAWAAGDQQGLDDAWQDVIVDLGSQSGQYEYVTGNGFAAWTVLYADLSACQPFRVPCPAGVW
ncbi:hypothetical protein [Streptomyces sp. NPDC056255]|uniref:hypothetical protein n=1 Tax=Streptomyces sp. NPDC056255 TaxID=3345764 RepID=UPI0035E32FA1